MALNSSGQISLNSNVRGESVSLELGLNSGATLNMLDASVRTFTGKASGAILMPADFYGKTALNQYPFSNYTFTTGGVGGYPGQGSGPTSDPGTVRPTSGDFSGQSAAVSYALTLRRYWANSGGGSQTFQSPRDSVFVATNTNWTLTDLINMGIVPSDVTTTSAARTVNVTIDLDDRWYGGYFIVTRSGAPSALSLWTSGVWTQRVETHQPGGGRQRDLRFSWTLPIPTVNQLVIPAFYDNNGCENLRWSFT